MCSGSAACTGCAGNHQATCARTVSTFPAHACLLDDTATWHVLGYTGGLIDEATDFNEYGVQRRDLLASVARAVAAGHDAVYLTCLKHDG